MGEASTETFFAALLGVFALVAFAFLFLAMLVGGGGNVDHLAHFYGLTFGGASEAVFVLAGQDPDGGS